MEQANEIPESKASANITTGLPDIALRVLPKMHLCQCDKYMPEFRERIRVEEYQKLKQYYPVQSVENSYGQGY